MEGKWDLEVIKVTLSTVHLHPVCCVKNDAELQANHNRRWQFPLRLLHPPPPSFWYSQVPPVPPRLERSLWPPLPPHNLIINTQIKLNISMLTPSLRLSIYNYKRHNTPTQLCSSMNGMDKFHLILFPPLETVNYSSPLELPPPQVPGGGALPVA